jgi:EmrB/QacA subfamily drug resistance transporter
MIVVQEQTVAHKRWVLAAMTCCLSCLFLDTSIIPVALPSIQKDMALSGLFMQWILNIFYIACAVCVIFAGKLSDILGRKKIFCVGCALYGMGAIFAGTVSGPICLLLLRALQGVGAALMMPSAMSILMAEFLPHELGRALGFSAGVSSIFLCIGPFLAGVVTEFVSWRYIFILPLPICFTGYLLTILFVPKGTKIQSKLDFKGFILLIVGLSSLLFALMEAKQWGLFSIRLFNYTLFSSLALIVLYYHSKFIEFPLVDLKLFKCPFFSVGLLLGFICQFIAVYTVFIAIFFQKAMLMSPIETGAYIVLANLPILLMAPASGILIDRKGARFPIILGFFSLLISMTFLIGFTLIRKQFMLFVALATFGCSQSLITTPVSYLALKQIPSSHKGLAAGIFHTVRYLGSALGIVCIGWVGYFFRLTAIDHLLKKNSLTFGIDAAKVDEFAKMTHILSDEIINRLNQINNHSFYISLNAMSLFICLFVCFGLLLTFVYLNDYKKA